MSGSKIIRIVLIVAGALFIIDALILSLIASFNLGFLAAFILGVLCLGYGLFFEKLNCLSRKGVAKYLKYAVFAVISISILLSLFLAAYGQIDTVTFNEDAVIILGAGIDGESVTLPLQYRLEKGLEYLRKNPKAVIVVSGGQGYGESITEALAMERYLIKNGVPQSKILMEEKATSTYENFTFSKTILDAYFDAQSNSQPQPQSQLQPKPRYKCAFITNAFHVFRAREISKIAGMNCTYEHAKLQWYLIPTEYLREDMAVVKLLVFRR